MLVDLIDVIDVIIIVGIQWIFGSKVVDIVNIHYCIDTVSGMLHQLFIWAA